MYLYVRNLSLNPVLTAWVWWFISHCHQNDRL